MSLEIFNYWAKTLKTFFKKCYLFKRRVVFDEKYHSGGGGYLKTTTLYSCVVYLIKMLNNLS